MTVIPNFFSDIVPEKTSLSDQAYRYIQRKIVVAEYPPLFMLNEIEIAKELGISRTPVREAIKRLENDGLLCLKPNCGAEVIGLSKEEMYNILIIRAFLEGLAAKLAATTMDNKTRALLQEIIDLQQFYYERNDPEQCWKAGNAFHSVIYNSCSSRHVITLLRTYHTYIYLWMEKNMMKRNDQHPKEALEAHKTILSAINAKDAELSQRLMSEHLEQTFYSL